MINSKTKLSLMIALEIPAIFFSIVIFIHFALNRQIRFKLKNHGWIILLIVNFVQLTVDLPMSMSYFYRDGVWPQTNAYCVWWTWCEYSLNTIGLFLMTWISIERHIFVFHPHAYLQVLWKQWIFHYIPFILCFIWTPILYLVIVVISPYCTTDWDFNYLICGNPCYFTANFIGQFDFIFNIAIPVFIIMIANVTLIIRVIYQRISRDQPINWRRHRKMVFQLWIVSSLYMAFWLPTTITQLIQITIMPSFMIDQAETILFIVYFIPLLLPIICFSTQLKLVKKILNIIPKPRLNVVGLVIFTPREQQIAANVTIH